MKKALLLLTCYFYLSSINSQVTGVDYWIDFDTTNCEYLGYLIITEGSATAPIETIQNSAAWVLATPKELTINNVISVNPTNNTWGISLTYLEPANNPNFNYYQILASQVPAKFYDPVVTGDTVLLFRAQASHNMHGEDGIRAGNTEDAQPITNNFRMGVGGPQLQNIRQQGTPDVFAELDPIDLYLGITNTLSPTSGGTWSNSDNAVVSLSGNDVTGLVEGFSILTFTPNNGACSSSTVVRVSQNDVISEVDYRIDFNDSEGVYDCKIIVNEGAAIAPGERIQFGSTYSIVVPISATLKNLTSEEPSATMWSVVDSVVAPATDPLHKFYQISTNGLPVTMHDIILTGDEVTLFKVELDYDFHSQEGIRNFINGSDLIGNSFSMNNDFNLGAVNQAYNTNLPVQLPDEFAQLDGSSTLLTGETAVISPAGSTLYSIEDPSIISIDASNVITGLAQGTTIITYSPLTGSNSDVEITVNGSLPLNSVDYRIEFDESNCMYNCYAVATNGNALTMNERLAGSGTFSIAVPKDVNITDLSSINPGLATWELGDSLKFPVEDPSRNFYQITSNPMSAEFYDPIFEGDAVLLFSIELSDNTHGPSGIRNYINGSDPNGNTFSIENDFRIGTSLDIYNSNQDPVFPSTYATAALETIDIGMSTTVIATGNGSWTTNGSTAATFDPQTNTVTGIEEGTIVLTYTEVPDCPSSVVITIENPPHDPISEVDYFVKFNGLTCNYDCYMKVISGSALTPIERLQFASSFTLVTAAETNLQLVESVAPNATAWYFNQSELAPVDDPEHNFYHFTTAATTNNVHAFLYEEDEVLLFSVSLDDNIQGMADGIRVFDNTNDSPNVSVSIQNEFNIGNIDDQYRQNNPTLFPAVFADAPSGTEINTGQTTELVPTSGGTWSNSNTTVSQRIGTTVTGFADGYSMYTFTPGPMSNLCPSSVVIHVTTEPHDPISEVDYKIRFNEDNCNYEALMIIQEGSAITMAERLHFASNYTVVTPAGINISMIESVSPSSITWNPGITQLSPATDPTKNFFQVLSTTNQVEFYDFLYPEDEVILFTFEADYDVHYSAGIRNFKNGVDMPSVSLQNEFKIGSPNTVYSANMDSDLPSSFADTTNTSQIFVSQSTTLTAPTVGSWSSSDDLIATVDANTGEVTGVGLGQVFITHDPTNDPNCTSTVIINVIPHQSLTEVEYKLTWDESNNEYIASMIAISGNAILQSERVQLVSTFSIVTPSLVTPTITSTNPSTSAWEFADIIIAPPSDPLHNFYQVLTDGLPVVPFDIILEGDEVELFRISMDINVHGNNGLRILENGVDLINNPLDIDNEFNLGGISDQYQGNASRALPVTYAETNTEYVVLAGETTMAIPVSPGNWVNSNTSIASLDDAGLVTALAVGNTILTYTPNNGNEPSSVIIYVIPNENSTVTKVDFKLEFDDTTCDTYNCYMVIKEGAAYTPANLIQGNATYTIVTPKDITVTFDESISPNSNTWGNGDTNLAPTEDSLHNFFSFYPNLNSTSFYDPLEENDEVLLFKITATSLAHGPKGIRLFKNDTDLPNSPLSFDHGITIGNINQIYNANQQGQYPSDYAEAIGPSDIIIGGQTTLIPSSGGDWTNSDNTIVSLDAENVITGLMNGTSLLTFNPTVMGACPTTFSINVIDELESCAVAFGTEEPATSALLDVYSTEKGILIPRMSQAQRLCIASPPDGLMVFQMDQNSGFYYFNGSSWTRLDDTITNGTSNLQNENPNTTNSKSSSQNLIELLKQQQTLLEKKLNEQDKLIESLKNTIKNN